MSYKESIKDFCESIGLTLVGFTECRRFDELKSLFLKRKAEGKENEFEEADIEKRVNPFIYMEDGKTIISIVFPYIYENNETPQMYFSKYTLGEDYHQVVSKYLEKVCSFINSLGGKAKYFVDSNALPERYIAYLCGVGFVGKNGLLITKEYGSYVFLGEIITDLEIEKDIPKESLCEGCSLCINACPTKAISKNSCNSNICLSYITQKKHIEDYWFKMLQGRIFGCDTCQEVCPHNKHIKYSSIEEFRPFEFMKKPKGEELLNLGKKEFNEKYKLTSCGWRGKNVIQRNALINLFNLDKVDKATIDKIKSPYIKEYYNRLLKKSNL